jgi:BASS family bile acid:Na+ symporter
MEIVTKIAPLCLAIIMFSLGLGLTINDFLRVIKYPKNFFVGFICQVILLPIIAFILINLITLTPEIALGVMIIAAAPGGVTSNVLTKFANGDVALSISLTAIVSLISIATVPFIVFHSAEFLEIEILKEIAMSSIATKMFFVVTVPVLLGMIIRKLKQDLVIAYESLFQKISIILFLIVFTAIWVEEWGEIMSFIKTAGLISIILNITMIIIGFYVAKFLVSGIAQRKSISLECGLQNGTLAVYVAVQLFDQKVYLVPSAAYVLVMFVTSIFFVLLVRKIN